MARTVLFFESHSGFFDGAQQSLCLLLKHLDRERFRPIFMGPEDGSLTAKLTEIGVPTRIVRPGAQLARYQGAILRQSVWQKIALLLPYVAYTRKVLRVLRDERVELVHCNSIRSLLTVALAGKLVRVPLLWHLRLNLDLGWWNRIALKLADRIIVVSDSLREQFPGSRVYPAKFVTVPNGLELTKLAPNDGSRRLREALGIEPGWQAVGTVGSLTPRKGHLVLLEAVRRVVRSRPQTKLIVVGGARGPEEEAYAGRLRRAVAESGLLRRVTFTGWRSDVADILAALDVFVLASQNEGLPRVLLEAMALALPVVATAVGGNADLVSPGETGLLVPPDDPELLAKGILRILDSPEAARAMGERGRKRVAERFSLEASVRGVEAVMDAVLAARSGPHWLPGVKRTEPTRSVG